MIPAPAEVARNINSAMVYSRVVSTVRALMPDQLLFISSIAFCILV